MAAACTELLRRDLPTPWWVRPRARGAGTSPNEQIGGRRRGNLAALTPRVSITRAELRASARTRFGSSRARAEDQRNPWAWARARRAASRAWSAASRSFAAASRRPACSSRSAWSSARTALCSRARAVCSKVRTQALRVCLARVCTSFEVGVTAFTLPSDARSPPSPDGHERRRWLPDRDLETAAVALHAVRAVSTAPTTRGWAWRSWSRRGINRLERAGSQAADAGLRSVAPRGDAGRDAT